MEEEDVEIREEESAPPQDSEKKERGRKEEEKDKKESRSQSQPSRKSSKTSKASFTASQQQLFLVEFLVDSVCIDSCSVDEEILQGQTCISLSFLNFPPMEICEKDFNPNKESGTGKVKFNCGKSLMFALNDNQCERPPPLAVEITVYKKLEEGENPVKVEIGVIKICISELFRQIVEIAKFKPDLLPASKSIKDCFMLIGPGKRTMGQVSVYIRLSCLGQNVVTEFQCGSDLKTSPILFKNREGKKMFEFTGGESPEDGEGGAYGACVGHHPQTPGGGQGDGGKSPSVTATYSRGNRVVLDLPSRGNKSQKSDKCRMAGDYKKAQDPSCRKDGAATVEENSNPNENVFVLKVGDKGQIPDRGKMILELKTPKQRILQKLLPPYHEDVAVQTDTGKKGKGKGKNKKGK